MKKYQSARRKYLNFFGKYFRVKFKLDKKLNWLWLFLFIVHFIGVKGQSFYNFEARGLNF